MNTPPPERQLAELLAIVIERGDHNLCTRARDALHALVDYHAENETYS